MTTQTERNTRKYTWTMWIVSIAGFLLAVAVVQLQFRLVGKAADADKLQAIGVSGDMAGALNAVFSGLAFIVLIITLRMQQDELRMVSDQLELQRQEFEMTRDVLIAQEKELHDQRRAMQAQVFENALFRLVELFIDAGSSIKMNAGDGQELEGRVFFQEFLRIISNNDRPEILERVVRDVLKNHSRYEVYLLRFRAISELWADSQFNDSEYYPKIIRNLLSDGERFFIAVASIQTGRLTTIIENLVVPEDLSDVVSDQYRKLKASSLIPVSTK